MPMAEPEGRFRDIEAAARPTFNIIVRAEPQVDEAEAWRGLRRLLKDMGRGYRLRCLSVTEIRQEPERR